MKHRQILEGMLGYLTIYNYKEILDGDLIMFNIDNSSLTDYELRMLFDTFRRVDINAVCGDGNKKNLNIIVSPKLDNVA